MQNCKEKLIPSKQERQYQAVRPASSILGSATIVAQIPLSQLVHRRREDSCLTTAAGGLERDLNGKHKHPATYSSTQSSTLLQLYTVVIWIGTIAVQGIRLEHTLERTPPATEGEEGKRNWYRDINSHHANLNLMLKFSSGVP
jgi:hypothetical protein